MNLQRQTNFSVSSVGVPIRNTADYSPFGVQLDGRTIQGDFYRRGFNGMEKDDEVKGGGNSYDFGARMYDSRVGRWLSRDNVTKPNFSTYQASRNNPVIFIDPDGNDDIYFNHSYGWYEKNGKLRRVSDGKRNYLLPIADIIDKKPGNDRYFHITSDVINVEYGNQSYCWNSNMILSKQQMEKEAYLKILGKIDPRKESVEINSQWTVKDGIEQLMVSYVIKEHRVIEINSPKTIAGGDEIGNGYTNRAKIYHLDMVNTIVKGFKGKSWGRIGIFGNLHNLKDFIDESKQHGTLDFKNALYLNETTLYNIDGIYYNKNEAGNYYYGYALAALGFSRMDADFIANEGSKILDPSRSGDENWELDALIDGWNRFVHGRGSAGSKIDMYENH